MQDKLLVLDAKLAEMQRAVRDMLTMVPPGKAYQIVTLRLLRAEVCLFAAHAELADAISYAKAWELTHDVSK